MLLEKPVTPYGRIMAVAVHSENIYSVLLVVVYEPKVSKCYSKPQFYEWLRMASRSYEDTEREVSQKFGRAWHMLSDKEFNRLSAAQLTASVH
ncbi:hypothetical protein J6590_088539 [Homalodisca vitripennis]|nr:hypothetical protein J6590_088539 [Homalodisca vitripennis]